MVRDVGARSIGERRARYDWAAGWGVLARSTSMPVSAAGDGASERDAPLMRASSWVADGSTEVASLSHADETTPASAT